MKRNLELNIPDDRIFLNFWNSYNGDDVTCQIIDGKLFLEELFSEGGDLMNEPELKEISLQEFIDLIISKEFYKNS